MEYLLENQQSFQHPQNRVFEQDLHNANKFSLLMYLYFRMKFNYQRTRMYHQLGSFKFIPEKSINVIKLWSQIGGICLQDRRHHRVLTHQGTNQPSVVFYCSHLALTLSLLLSYEGILLRGIKGPPIIRRYLIITNFFDVRQALFWIKLRSLRFVYDISRDIHNTLL